MVGDARNVCDELARTLCRVFPTMKTSLWFRMQGVAALLWLLCANAGFAADPYKIVSLRPYWSNDLIYVGNMWRKDLPKRMLVTLRVDADTPSSGIFVKTYFYDKDDKLVGSFDRPNKIWTVTAKGLGEAGLPTTLLRTKTTDVYFAIPEELQAKNFTTVLAVFGDSTKVSVNCLPATKLPQLDFPEKAELAASSPAP